MRHEISQCITAYHLLKYRSTQITKGMTAFLASATSLNRSLYHLKKKDTCNESLCPVATRGVAVVLQISSIPMSNPEEAKS